MIAPLVINVLEYVATEYDEYQKLLNEAVETGNELEQIMLFRDLYLHNRFREPRDAWREITYLESALWVFEHAKNKHLPIGTYYRTARDLAYSYLALVMDTAAGMRAFERALEFSKRPEVKGKGRLELEWLRRGHAWLRGDMAKGRSGS